MNENGLLCYSLILRTIESASFLGYLETMAEMLQKGINISETVLMIDNASYHLLAEQFSHKTITNGYGFLDHLLVILNLIQLNYFLIK